MSVRREREARRRVVDLERAEEGAFGRQDCNTIICCHVDAPGAVDGEARRAFAATLVECSRRVASRALARERVDRGRRTDVERPGVGREGKSQGRRRQLARAAGRADAEGGGVGVEAAL